MARIPDHILDDIRARLPVSRVVGRRVQLKRAGREWKGLSPFKSEKTPSFFVNDQKGFWHDFASGEHGDIFTFVMKTEGLDFREAAERLAQEAGVDIPKDAPATEEQVAIVEQADRLRAILADSAAWYVAQLSTASGSACRRYLVEKRGLSDETIVHFGIGYAPASRTALKDHLLTKKHAVADMVSAGMLIGGDDIDVPYDRFRGRAMFPIKDLKGRVIAFGGRALDPDQTPKYLNSPETPIFHKGDVLYNFVEARRAAHGAKRVIVAEGYMDVVGLHQGGITESVASLGTALTSEHLTLLWRAHPEPILAFDGDVAGQRAAFRAIDVALPIIEPDQTLSFAFMPPGDDPDDLIKSGGKEAVDRVLAERIPLIDMLWKRETATPAVTPEQRAALEQRLYSLVDRIAHNDLRQQYRREIKDRLWRMMRPTPTARATGKVAGAQSRLSGISATQSHWNGSQRPSTGRFERQQPAQLSQELLELANRPSARESWLLATIMRDTDLLIDVFEPLTSLQLGWKAFEPLRAVLIDWVTRAADDIDAAPPLRHVIDSAGLTRVAQLVDETAAALPKQVTENIRQEWLDVAALHSSTLLRAARRSAAQPQHQGSDVRHVRAV